MERNGKYNVTLKNTFIHVTAATPAQRGDDDDDVGAPATRQMSDPTPSASHRSESSSTNHQSASSDTLAMDKLLQPGSPGGKPGDKEESDVGPSEEEAERAEEDEPGRTASSQRRGRGHPNKSRRDRYRATVDRYFEQIRSDPHGFDAEWVEVPGFVAADPFLERKLRQRLRDHVQLCRDAPAPAGASQEPAPSSAVNAGTAGVGGRWRRQAAELDTAAAPSGSGAAQAAGRHAGGGDRHRNIVSL